jgi:formylglycine-generating enzyme
MKTLLSALGLVSAALLFVSLPRVVHGQGLGQGWRSIVTKQAPAPSRVWFPATAFRMGSTPEEVLEAMSQCAEEPLSPRCPDFSNEQPVRTIQLSRFALDPSEVSAAAYAHCVTARRCRPVPYYRGARRFQVDAWPVVLVTHHDAQTYCAFVGGRLPTEAQFERAARGLSRRKYPWGNHYHRLLANHGRLAFNPTSTADGNLELTIANSYASGASPEGVLNLAGNAAEWVSDSYSAYYDENETLNPIGPRSDSGTTERVVRGGGYLSPVVQLRGAARRPEAPTLQSAEVGFRCAYTAP